MTEYVAVPNRPATMRAQHPDGVGAARAPARKPRVLLVGPMPPTTGGVTTFMLNLMASHLREEFDFVPFSTSRPPKRNVTDNYGYGAMFRGGLRRVLLGAAITLWNVARFPAKVLTTRADIVQIQASDYQAFWESAVYAILARLLGRVVLMRIGGAFDHFHGHAAPFARRLIGAALRHPDGLIAQSDFARQYLVAAGRRSGITVVPNWSSRPVFDAPRPDRQSPVCLFVAGSDAHRKGIEEVLAAAARLQQQGSPATLHLLAMSPVLVARVAELGLANVVAREGPVPHPQLLDIMRDADIFLLPSHGEGFPNSLIEAMAAGMAPVATPVGAVPEIASDAGVVLVPVRDPVALADAIARLAADPELRRDVGAKARDTVRHRFMPQAALSGLGALYRDALAQSGAQRQRA